MPADFVPDLVQRYDLPGPCLTAYPGVSRFGPFTPVDHERAVHAGNAATPTAALSLHLHLSSHSDPPLTASEPVAATATATADLRWLLHEVDLQAALFRKRRPVERLHFGGAPCGYTDEQLGALLTALESRFGFAAAERREFSIRIDPAQVDPQRLVRIAAMGFRRMLLALQPPDPGSASRAPANARIDALIEAARGLGLHPISFDLGCGLLPPVAARFGRTLDRVIAWQPDRVAIRAASWPPAAALRLPLRQLAVERLVGAGYVYIGLDHFALPDDELALAIERNRLQHNFQGYSARARLDVLGLGPGRISRIDGAYSQNAAAPAEYRAALEAGRLPVTRGRLLTREDQLRALVIERILCGREVHYGLLGTRFGVDFREHFRSALLWLAPAERDGLVRRLPDSLCITPRGRYVLPALARPFDAYPRRAETDSALAASAPA